MAILAFKHLQATQALCLPYARALPRRELAATLWVGIGFTLFQSKLLVSLQEIQEVIRVPTYSHVPDAPTWLLGIANFRGEMLPLLDLRNLVGGPQQIITARSRIFVVEFQGTLNGLLVESVLGLFKLDEKSAIPLADCTPHGQLDNFSKCGYLYDHYEIKVFSVMQVLNTHVTPGEEMNHA